MVVAASLAYRIDGFLDKHRPGPGETGTKDYYIGRLVLLKTLQKALELDYSRGAYSQENYINLRTKLEGFITEAERNCELKYSG